MSTNDAIRTFVAVEIPESERAVLAEVISRFEPLQSLLKVVTPELLHITARFLGPVPLYRMGAIETAAGAAAAGMKPFELALGGIGAFPGERAPRVLWVGVQGTGRDSLRRLVRDLNVKLAAQGFEQDPREFSPHITLARARDGLTATERRRIADALERVQGSAIPPRTFKVRDLIVMRSDPGPAGPRYTPLLRTPLGRREVG